MTQKCELNSNAAMTGGGLPDTLIRPSDVVIEAMRKALYTSTAATEYGAMCDLITCKEAQAWLHSLSTPPVPSAPGDVVVPCEFTREMTEAAYRAFYKHKDAFPLEAAYKAAIAARPQGTRGV
jgi:hypothetical protein